MANIIKIKRGLSKHLWNAQLQEGEMAFTTDTKKLYISNTDEPINNDTTYSLSKSGSTITLTGSDGSTTSVSDSNTTYNEATSSEKGLMSANDKKRLDAIVTAYDMGSLAGKTKAQLQEYLDTWLTTYGNIPGAVAYFTAAGDWVTVWNSTDTTLTISAGGRYVVSVVGTYGTKDYTQLRFSTYHDEYVFYVAKSGGIWRDAHQVAYKDDLPSNATTSAAGLMSAADKAKLNGIAEGANNYTYTLPTASSTLGGVKTTSTVTSTSGLTACPIIGGVPYYKDTNTTYTLPNASSSTLGGVKIGSNITVSSGTISLTKDNVTAALGYTPPTTNTTYSVATTSANGLMSSTDKSKLDGIATGATKNTASSTTPKANGTAAVGSESNYARGDHIHPLQTTVSGNAGTATKLATARTLTIGGTGKTFDGSGNVSWSLAEIGAASSSHTHNYLPLTGGSLIGHLEVINKYELGSFYNYTNGCLIEIGNAESYLMVSIHITGNSYTSGVSPINSMYQFYNYGTEGGFLAYSGRNFGYPLGAMTIFRYNGKVYAWIKQPVQYQTLSFQLLTNQTGLVPIVSNAAIPSSGTTLQTTITPDSLTNSPATTSANGLMTSAMVTKLNGIATGANAYTLPNATSSVLGGVKIGSNITVSSGTISLTKTNVTTALGYTPPTTNTTYSAGTGISLSGTTFSNSGVRSIATGSSNGTISVNTNGTSANVAVKGLGSAAYTASSDYAPNSTALKVFNRNNIGSAPNFDDPGVNGFFEVRPGETPNATGTPPMAGYYGLLNLKTPDNIAMMQIAGSHDNFYIRGTQTANVTLGNVPWRKIGLGANVKVSTTQPSTSEADVWINPNGQSALDAVSVVGEYAEYRLTAHQSVSQSANWGDIFVPFSTGTFTTSNSSMFSASGNGIKCNFTGRVIVFANIGTGQTGKELDLEIYNSNGSPSERSTINISQGTVNSGHVFDVNSGSVISAGFNSNSLSFTIYSSSTLIVTRLK